MKKCVILRNIAFLSLKSGIFLFAIIICTAFSFSPAHGQAASTQPGPQNEQAMNVYQFGYDEIVPSDVKKAAIEGLHPFLNSIPPLDLEHYGFPKGSDFEGVTLGQPYRVFTIDPEKLTSNAVSDDIRSLLTITNMWFFPVMQDGEPRTILTIDFFQGTWKAVSIGSSGLAKQLDRMEKAWNNQSNYSRVFVRIFQAKSDIMLIMKDNNISVAPFESARASLDFTNLNHDAEETFKCRDIMNALIPVVHDDLKENNNTK